PTPGTNAQGTFTWYVSQTVAGCESQRIPVEVRVNYVPNALITISRPYVCQYDTISLNYFGNATPAADYIWTLPTGGSIVEGSGQGPLIVRFDTAGTMRVGLQVDNGGCKGPATFLDVPVREVPRLALDLQPDACVGEPINLAVAWTTTSIDKYDWDYDGGNMIYGSIPAGPFGIRWDTPGEKIVRVLATDNECTSLPVYDTIDVHARPDATITALGPINICAGDTVLLEGVYDADNSYKWRPEQYFSARNSYQESAKIDFIGYVSLTVTNEFNCVSTDSLLINAEPCCDVYFPNAFTPNNDGLNDVFRMIRKGGTNTISVFRVQNRWGQTVFETADDRSSWDGTFNGKPQDMGTYHYYIRYKCADGNYYDDKGEFMLIR
ncbi:MAG: gliding motility-associated C-terminal domain-containing protein, partial [Sphingobacteriales bacterium]